MTSPSFAMLDLSKSISVNFFLLTLYAMMATALPVAASSLWEVAWHTWKNH
jgi:hypothetical protein